MPSTAVNVDLPDFGRYNMTGYKRRKEMFVSGKLVPVSGEGGSKDSPRNACVGG